MTWRGKVWRILRGPALAAGGMTTAALGANTAAAIGEDLEASGNPDRAPVLLPNTLNANGRGTGMRRTGAIVPTAVTGVTGRAAAECDRPLPRRRHNRNISHRRRARPRR